MMNRTNKKGSVITIIIFFLVIFTILIVGFMASMIGSSIDYVADEVTPVLREVGVIDSEHIGTNFSEAVDYVVVPTNVVVQAFPWLIGFSYVAALIFSLVFVISYRETQSPWFLGFYFALVLLLIVGAIIMSQMYQDVYTGTDEIATRLQEQTLMSYMILHSPLILTIISLVGGIYMFTRRESDL